MSTPISGGALARWAGRLPAHVVNGITVALGVAGVHGLLGALAGPHAAQLAISGAIYASLGDLPTTPGRSWPRVLAAAAVGCATALLMVLLAPAPLARGVGIAALVFLASMVMAWGPRAGPVSFAAVLSIVFTMGLPPGQPPLPLLGWHLLGAALYLPWSLAVTAALQPRYRRAALAAALDATARLLSSRAALLAAAGPAGAATSPLQAWLRDEATLAERLQQARDLLFAAPDSPRTRRETAMLLHAIELRDVLLASRLDLDLLGDDAVARQLRDTLAQQLRQLADALAAAMAGLQGHPLPAAAAGPATALAPTVAAPGLAADDPRARLLPAFGHRLQHLRGLVDRIGALGRGADEPLPLSRDELRLFVAPEGWPLAALRPHASLDSPVLRHALRAALALSAAYAIALWLPWRSHPQWLVLSVAVVLRGNLAQTLSRRNVRVLGTLLGCLIVLGLVRIPSPALLTAVFLGAVGLAHGFAVERYLVTATTATVMSLLQAHLVQPDAGMPIAERLADTVLGALLAWGFSYVLPSWERRSLPQAIQRAMLALQGYARQALRSDSGGAVAQRLARRQAYDALGVLAAALQRGAVEPERVRPPLPELSALLDHAQRLMAHLSVVRLMLARHAPALAAPAALAALQQGADRLSATLDPATPGATDAAGPLGLDQLPAEPPSQELLPWLQWRLQVTQHDSLQVARAWRAALARLRAPAG